MDIALFFNRESSPLTGGVVYGTASPYPADPGPLHNSNIPVAMALKLQMPVTSCCFQLEEC